MQFFQQPGIGTHERQSGQVTHRRSRGSGRLFTVPRQQHGRGISLRNALAVGTVSCSTEDSSVGLRMGAGHQEGQATSFALSPVRQRGERDSKTELMLKHANVMKMP